MKEEINNHMNREQINEGINEVTQMGICREDWWCMCRRLSNMVEFTFSFVILQSKTRYNLEASN